jgi:DNA-binding response OmpR family regulator
LTKILIVDDEPAQSRGLSRAIRLRRPDYTVLTSGDGIEAVSLLEAQQVDLVLTDLQMDAMNGFELLSWLSQYRPSVLAFAMTGESGADTEARLSELGAVEAFSKPLDIDALLHRVSEGLAERIRGHVQNVGLASFLQFVELEHKTCTLEVQSGEKRGTLFLRKGELVDARTADLVGEAAALVIIGWDDTSITIESGCRNVERRIAKPINFLVLEALRVHDEALRPPDDEPCVLEPTTQVRAVYASSESPHLPVGVLAFSMVDVATGHISVGATRGDVAIEEVAQGAHALLTQQLATLSRAAPGETLDELVVMTASRCEVIRLLGERFVLLVFDPSLTNLVMARFELATFVREYAASA